MMRVDVRQRHRLLAELALGVGHHRLDDVAAEVTVLRPVRLDLVAHVGRPDHLVGADLDVLALEEVGAVPVAGEVEHAVALRLERLGDREQHGVAEAAAGEQHRRLLGNLGRRAGRAHHDDGLARA